VNSSKAAIGNRAKADPARPGAGTPGWKIAGLATPRSASEYAADQG
jgi:hypothetical protein